MKLLTPGFWDLHIHGVSGIDFIFAKEEQLLEACYRLGSEGIAFFAPTLLTCPEKLLLESTTRWGKFLEKTKNPKFLPPTFAKPIGLHLEGPFLAPNRAGAHRSKDLKIPSIPLFEKLYRQAKGRVAILTLAPELTGAPALIRKATALGVRVQLGHTQATGLQIQAALKAGAQGFTHLWNAMHIHHREPGPLEALITNPKAQTEIITDGIHVHPALCWHVLHKFEAQAYGVSDACPALALPENKPTQMGTIKLKRKGPVAYVQGKSQTLAGGATWITSHPERLWKHLPKHIKTKANANLLLQAFYKPQQNIFKKVFLSSPQRKIKNQFDKQTLKFQTKKIKK